MRPFLFRLHSPPIFFFLFGLSNSHVFLRPFLSHLVALFFPMRTTGRSKVFDETFFAICEIGKGVERCRWACKKRNKKDLRANGASS